jgi:carbamoyltransferase
MKILGLNDGFDAGVALVVDGALVAAVNEERLSRIKFHRGYHDGFPYRSLEAVLRAADFPPLEIDAVVITNYAFPPLLMRLRGLNANRRNQRTDYESMPLLASTLGQKVINYIISLRSEAHVARASARILKEVLACKLRQYGLEKVPIYFVDHHMAHAACAYYTSGRDKGLAITFDGYGDGLSGTISVCRDGQIRRIRSFPAAHSLAVFYGAATVLAGFKFNRHEGKLTGLAAYGKGTEILGEFRRFIYLEPISQEIKSSLGTNQFECIRKMTQKLAGRYSREEVAAGAQIQLESIVLPLIQKSLRQTSQANLFCAGGLFANVKLNKEINQLPEVKFLYVFPAMGDGGQAAGAALYLHHKLCPQQCGPTRLHSVYLGPDFSESHIRGVVENSGIPFEFYGTSIEDRVAELLAKGKVVARFNSRLEFGPRALGNRSILYQATDPTVNDWLNRRLNRGEFMPFAPTTMESDATLCYRKISSALYSARFMNVAFATTPEMQRRCPGVIHVDGTARPQILRKSDNPSFFKILEVYKKMTGLGSIINTSLNMHEEPIVATPQEAITTFLTGDLDYLALGKFLLTHPRNDR